MDINSAVGRKAGLSDDKLLAVKGDDLTVFSPVEQLVIELADRMAETPSNISDELYARLRAQFSEEQLLDFIENLKSSPEYREKGEALKEKFLENPVLQDYLANLWDDIKARLLQDAASPDSRE